MDGIRDEEEERRGGSSMKYVRSKEELISGYHNGF